MKANDLGVSFHCKTLSNVICVILYNSGFIKDKYYFLKVFFQQKSLNKIVYLFSNVKKTNALATETDSDTQFRFM